MIVSSGAAQPTLGSRWWRQLGQEGVATIPQDGDPAKCDGTDGRPTLSNDPRPPGEPSVCWVLGDEPAAAASLTPREREILAWVARGNTNQEIAAVLQLAPGTVRKHLDNIYKKLDVPNRTTAVTRAYQPTAPTGAKWVQDSRLI